MKKTKQAMAPGPDLRKEYGTERKGMHLENQELAIPKSEKGFSVVKTPSMDQGPAVPPLAPGRNWNATRPKAPQAAK